MTVWFEAWRRRALARVEALECKRIAKVFNDRYTYRKPLVKDAPRNLPGSFYGFMPHSSGYAWMCPQCNRTHHPVADSVFSGLLYPPCCDTPYGDRLYEGIRTS